MQSTDAFRRVLIECCLEIEKEIDSTVQPELMVDEEGKSRGFGFCLMKNHEAVKKLVDAVNGKEVGGKTLFASRAMGREERIRQVQENLAKWRTIVTSMSVVSTKQ